MTSGKGSLCGRAWAPFFFRTEQSWCTLFDRLVRATQRNLLPRVGEFASLFAGLVAGNAFTTVLRTCEELGVHFGADEPAALTQLLYAAIGGTFARLHTNLRARPDVVTHFFLMVRRYIRACPGVVAQLHVDALSQVLELAIASFALPEHSVLRANLMFLVPRERGDPRNGQGGGIRATGREGGSAQRAGGREGARGAG